MCELAVCRKHHVSLTEVKCRQEGKAAGRKGKKREMQEAGREDKRKERMAGRVQSLHGVRHRSKL